MHAVPFLSIALIAALLVLEGGIFFSIASLLLAGLLIYVYIHQAQYMSKALGYSMRAQIVVVVTSFVATGIAGWIGDTAGLHEFGQYAASGIGVGGIAILSVLFSFMILDICAMSNAILIMRQRGPTSVLRALGGVGLGILWILVAVFAWLVNLIAHSMRDPNTE